MVWSRGIIVNTLNQWYAVVQKPHVALRYSSVSLTNAFSNAVYTCFKKLGKAVAGGLCVYYGWQTVQVTAR